MVAIAEKDRNVPGRGKSSHLLRGRADSECRAPNASSFRTSAAPFVPSNLGGEKQFPQSSSSIQSAVSAPSGASVKPSVSYELKGVHHGMIR